MALSHSPSIVIEGLVLCLDAANLKSYPGSGTSIIDLSGNNNNGTLVNGTTFNSANNGGFICDGVDDYINVTENANLKPQVLTAEIVVKINSTVNTGYGGDPTFQYLLFRQNSRTGSFEGYVINYGETDSSFSCGATPSGGTPQYQINSGADSGLLGKIYVVSCVFDTTMMYIYVNGVLKNSGSKATGIDYNNNHTLKIGRSVSTGINFDGAASATFYNVKIYNRALNASEVLQNFNALRGRFGI